MLVEILAEVALVIAEKVSDRKMHVPHLETTKKAWLADAALDWQSLAQKTFAL